MDFVGTAKRLEDGDIATIAEQIGVEEASLRAVLQVETGGKGYDAKNRPKALFERHKFWKELADTPDLQANAAGLGLAYPKWGEKPYPKDSDGVYSEISAACEIDLDGALRSTSWGLGQIMGSNYRMVGCATVQDMVEQAKQSEVMQLQQWVGFVKSANLLQALKNKDWAAFAKGYNGPGYATNKYDVKLAAAYDKFSSVA